MAGNHKSCSRHQLLNLKKAIRRRKLLKMNRFLTIFACALFYIVGGLLLINLNTVIGVVSKT